MNQKKKSINKIVITLILVISIFTIFYTIRVKNQKTKIVGNIYFNKPVTWEKAYIYLLDEKNEKEFHKWPGIELKNEEDYIYFFEVTELIANKINNCKIIFNDGENYKVEDSCKGYNKIYNITRGIGEQHEKTEGEWLEYSKDIKIGKIPTTESKIKNVIYMIGDGMGENHIIAGEIFKEKKLNIQNMENKTYVKTASLSTITDSAAAATALATGYKTANGVIGKDKNGENLENIIEYSNSKNMKTGIVCTQILNHATPAAFSVHSANRYNYDEIAKLQIESCLNLMLGGGRKYFFNYQSEMVQNNYIWINEISELNKIGKEKK